MEFSLEEDLVSSDEIAELAMNVKFAGELYAAMCNTQWMKANDDLNEEIVERLKGNPNCWHCSWRYAGGVVARLRNRKLDGEKETYMDWYCQGAEGHVSQEVEQVLSKMGWSYREWPENIEN